MCHDEQVLRLVIGPFSVLDLGIHVQAYFGGRGDLYLQIILEVVGKVVDVVVERVNLRRIQQTAIMVHVETHVIAHARAPPWRFTLARWLMAISLKEGRAS